jgi:oxaloacetate decarboxylase alpha subunit
VPSKRGIDNVDTAISSLSMTYGHSPPKTIVASFWKAPTATPAWIWWLEDIAAYFSDIRKNTPSSKAA